MNRKFKKFLSAVLAVVMVLSVLPVYALEEGVVYKYDAIDDPLGYIECYYDIYNGKARICSYSQPEYSLFTNSNLDQETIDETIEKYKTVIIPETINGYEVGYIRGGAFFFRDDDTETYHTSLTYATELILPDTIFFIDLCAIGFCNLQKLILPDNPNLFVGEMDECNIGELILPNKAELFELLISGHISKIVVPGGINTFNIYSGLSTIDELIVSEGVENVILTTGYRDTINKMHLPISLKTIEYDRSKDTIDIDTVFYAGTRADWSHLDPDFIIESIWMENGTEFVYKSIVENIDITPDFLEIYSGKSETLTTNITANTTDTSLYTVTYASSDEDVAKVDENGKVTAYGRGTATITCSVTDDNGHTVSDTCEVTVKYTFWRWLLRVFLYIIGINSRI